MSKACRAGDSFSGICSAHPIPVPFVGTWQVTRDWLTDNGLSLVIVGDTSPTSCGHTAQATAGSTITTPPLHRVGDAIIVIEGGDGISTTGSQFLEVA